MNALERLLQPWCALWGLGSATGLLMVYPYALALRWWLA